MTTSPVISVLGAGSYGTALALQLARNGHQTLLWGHDPEHVKRLNNDRENCQFLPDAKFPDTLQITDDLTLAASACRDILVVVPSFAFGEVLAKIASHLQTDARVAWATKGLEPETGRLLGDVAKEQLNPNTALAVLSGPTFAREIALGLPTAIAVAGEDDQFDADLATLLHCPKRFRVYRNPDFIGLQLGGAVKNVVAIAAGLSDGMGFGANARTALITRGLAELTRLGVALNADPATFMGMSGLGDLVLTCTDDQSRNRRFGLALGRGESVKDAEANIGQVVEGYRNTAEVYHLSQRLGIEMPITDQLYQVLYQGQSSKEAAINLLSREQTSESAG
ncbi:NAD(P)H-dependent glycerol-3-phosphate dehydrogenase [Echinimonas agarilytica]|uniref:Glycerol-3-phosphate dehydrogenase [NAD(P)+] n=1 Tax=Echinimonas agarilytica TaxID=1215918 RepID=A0AA41W9E1_9GAMM|nr:NAD(P)H-dependent glycerol-3-phosphate dehydrogenase [Echinimonas agarilytica]MCM2681047.1 NAD(P)H-dependent glycerol-3-phosphate dehydrogenase [Echinimonas agarilytica]